MILAIASGKGGTGKTLVATALAAAEADAGTAVTLVDCDVEAPNDHLFFELGEPESEIVSTRVAEVDAEKCIACGKCRDVCAYGAIRILGSSAMVFEEMCHGCGLCRAVCRDKAIKEPKRPVGTIESAPVLRDGADLTLVTGRLDVGQVKTPDVIRAARKAAAARDAELTILDAPPGVACAAVAAVNHTDAIVLVTEPTPFGLHDLDLSVQLARDMGVPFGVVVNRVDASGIDVDAWCAERDIPVLMHIPFDRDIAEAYAVGTLIGDSIDGYGASFSELAERLKELAGGVTV